MACQAASIHGDKLRKGPWLEEEDEQLVTFVTLFGERKWDFIAIASGLKRSGKSCRLRWLNYLRPNLKRGHISAEEEKIIIQLHELWGNKWAKIARKLPGRTDNEIKNYWRTHLRKKVEAQEGNLNNGKEDFLYQKGETSSWNCNMLEEYKSAEDNNNDNILGTDNDQETSLHQYYELSSLRFLNSPYETRLYDWISGGNDDDHSMKCYNNPDEEEGGENSILDSLGSLWDMN